MAFSASLLSSLLGELYEAAASPEHWPVFLERVRQQVDASCIYMILSDPRRRCDLSLQLGIDPALAELYVREFAMDDPLLEGYVAAQRRAGGDWIGTRESVLPDDVYFGCSGYQEILVPQRDLHVCAAGLSNLPDGLVGGLTVRRSRTQKNFDAETVALISALAPHVKRALVLHQRLTGLRAENAALEGSVAALDGAVLSLGAEGRVIQASPAAERLLAAGDGLELRGGRLEAIVAEDNQALQQLVAGSAGTGSGRGTAPMVAQGRRQAPESSSAGGWTLAFGGAVRIRRRAPRPPLEVSVMPFRSASVLVEDRPAVLVFVTNPERRPLSRGAVLRALYRLTPAELRLTERLVAGLSLKLAAGQLGLTESSARFQLKQIFRKTGTTSQAGLMRLVLLLPGTPGAAG